MIFIDHECVQIPIKAPGRARGELEITYLDEELRLVSFSELCIDTCLGRLIDLMIVLFHLLIDLAVYQEETKETCLS